MRTFGGLWVLAAAAWALAGCAGNPRAEATGLSAQEDCMFASTLRDWRPLDDEHLILFAIGRDPYLVELFRPVPSLSFDFTIGVYDRDGRICGYGGDAIIVDRGFRERVPIRAMRRLTPEQLEETYVEFGIRPPAVVDVEEAEVEGEGASE